MMVIKIDINIILRENSFVRFEMINIRFVM